MRSDVTKQRLKQNKLLSSTAQEENNPEETFPSQLQSLINRKIP